MQLSDFDYHLPEHLIARYPLEKRTDSRLMLVNRADKIISHHLFSELPKILSENYFMVFNNSKVMQARLYGQKPTGGKVELLIERVINSNSFKAHIKSNKSLKLPIKIILTDQNNQKSDSLLNIIENQNGVFYGEILNNNHSKLNIWEIMENYGHMPLPPYMNREDELSDQSRYQTVYAKDLGSCAAPTAGLHFNDEILKKLSQKNIQQGEVTLHVGAGTFQPVRVNDLDQHVMHSEWLSVSKDLVNQIKNQKSKQHKILAVGTTAVRSLETAAHLSNNHLIQPYEGESELFIYPNSGFKFKIVDALLTNFHLPKSTLLMLISTFAGCDLIKEAYQTAIENQYRFFSYGDAMLIV